MKDDTKGTRLVVAVSRAMMEQRAGWRSGRQSRTRSLTVDVHEMVQAGGQLDEPRLAADKLETGVFSPSTLVREEDSARYHPLKSHISQLFLRRDRRTYNSSPLALNDDHSSHVLDIVRPQRDRTTPSTLWCQRRFSIREINKRAGRVVLFGLACMISGVTGDKLGW